MSRDVFIVGRTPRTGFLVRLLCLTLGSFLLVHDTVPAAFMEGENPAYWDRAFWILLLEAFVLSWWSFEILFRPRYADIITRIPLPPRQWLLGTLSKLLEPLFTMLILGTILAFPLFDEDAMDGFIFMLSLVISCSFGFWGGAFWLYTALLGSLKSPGPFRQSMSKGLPSPEAALLFYAPAFAFGGGATMVLAVVFSIRLALLSAAPQTALVGVLAPFALGCIGIIRGCVHFSNVFPQNFASFSETERVLPFSESELPGQGEMDWGSEGPSVTARAVTLSMRRAFRVDLLFWLMGAAVVGWGFNTKAPITAFVGGLCVPLLFPFLLGRTLTRPWMHELIPSNMSPPPGQTAFQWTRVMTLLPLGLHKGVPTLALVVFGALSTTHPSFWFGGALSGAVLSWLGGLALVSSFVSKRAFSGQLHWTFTGLTILLIGFAVSGGGTTP